MVGAIGSVYSLHSRLAVVDTFASGFVDSGAWAELLFRWMSVRRTTTTRKTVWQSCLLNL